MTTENTIVDQVEIPAEATDTSVSADIVSENTPLGVLEERTEAAEASTAPDTEPVQEQPQTEPEAQVEAQPVAEASTPPPASEAAPAPAETTPPIIPSADSIDKQNLEAAQRELTELKKQAAFNELDTQVNEYKQQVASQLMATNQYTEEQAIGIAHQIGDTQKANYLQTTEIEARHQNDLAIEKGRYRAALKLSKESKGAIDADDLLQYDSAEAMRQAVNDRVEMADLKARLTNAERGAVQAQSFESGTAAVTGELSGSELEDAVGMGQVQLTPSVRKRILDYHKSIGVGA
jgi:hypothetical protein